MVGPLHLGSRVKQRCLVRIRGVLQKKGSSQVGSYSSTFFYLWWWWWWRCFLRLALELELLLLLWRLGEGALRYSGLGPSSIYSSRSSWGFLGGGAPFFGWEKSSSSSLGNIFYLGFVLLSVFVIGGWTTLGMGAKFSCVYFFCWIGG